MNFKVYLFYKCIRKYVSFILKLLIAFREHLYRFHNLLYSLIYSYFKFLLCFSTILIELFILKVYFDNSLIYDFSFVYLFESKPESCVVNVVKLQTLRDGGILDPDDFVRDVVEDKESVSLC